RSSWQSCGGKWAARWEQVRPSDITITVEPGPFLVAETTGGNIWVSGWTYLNQVRVSALSVTRIFDNPDAAELQTYKDLAAWEIGNSLATQIGYHPHAIDQEIGTRRPCDVTSY